MMVAKTAGELQEEVRSLLVEVEALSLQAGVRFPAAGLLRDLARLAARLEGFRPDQVPPAVLELEVELERIRARATAERKYLQWMQARPVTRLVVYQLLWLVSIALLTVTWWSHRERWAGLVPREVEVLIGCTLWGAVGACFSSILAMVRRRAERTLLPDYESWHLIKPLVGAFVGCLVYLILAGGIRFFNPADTGMNTGMYGIFTAVANRAYLAYLLSALMGYQERSFFTKVELLIKTLLGLQPPSSADPGAGPCPCCRCCPCCCGSPPPDTSLPPDPKQPAGKRRRQPGAPEGQRPPAARNAATLSLARRSRKKNGPTKA